MASSGASQPPRKPTGTNPQDTSADGSEIIFELLQTLHADLIYVRRQLLFVIQLMFGRNFQPDQPLEWSFEVEGETISIQMAEQEMSNSEWTNEIIRALMFINNKITSQGKKYVSYQWLLQLPVNQRLAKLLEVAVIGLRHLVWLKNKGLVDESNERNFSEYEKRGRNKILLLREGQDRTSKQKVLDKFAEQYKMFMDQVGRVAGESLTWLLNNAANLDLNRPKNVNLIEVAKCLCQVYFNLHPLADQVPMSEFVDVAREVFGRQEFEPEHDAQDQPIWFRPLKHRFYIKGWFGELNKKRERILNKEWLSGQGWGSDSATPSSSGTGFQRVSRTGPATGPSSTATTRVPFYPPPVEPPTGAMQPEQVGQPRTQQSLTKEEKDKFKSQGEKIYRQIVQGASGTQQGQGMSSTGTWIGQTTDAMQRLSLGPGSGTQPPYNPYLSPYAQGQPWPAAQQIQDTGATPTARWRLVDDPPEDNPPETEPELNREIFHFLREMRPNLFHARRQILVVMQLIFAGIPEFEWPTRVGEEQQVFDINHWERLTPNQWLVGFRNGANLYIDPSWTEEQRIAYYLEVAVEGLDYLIQMNAAGDRLFDDYLQRVRNQVGPTGHNRMVDDLENRFNQLSAQITNQNEWRNLLFQMADLLLRFQIKMDDREVTMMRVRNVFQCIHRVLSDIYFQLHPTPNQAHGVMEQFVDVASEIFDWDWRCEVEPDRHNRYHLFDLMRDDVYIRVGNEVLTRILGAEFAQSQERRFNLGEEEAEVMRVLRQKQIELRQLKQRMRQLGRGQAVRGTGRGEPAGGAPEGAFEGDGALE